MHLSTVALGALAAAAAAGGARAAPLPCACHAAHASSSSSAPSAAPAGPTAGTETIELISVPASEAQMLKYAGSPGLTSQGFWAPAPAQLYTGAGASPFRQAAWAGSLAPAELAFQRRDNTLASQPDSSAGASTDRSAGTPASSGGAAAQGYSDPWGVQASTAWLSPGILGRRENADAAAAGDDPWGVKASTAWLGGPGAPGVAAKTDKDNKPAPNSFGSITINGKQVVPPSTVGAADDKDKDKHAHVHEHVTEVKAKADGKPAKPLTPAQVAAHIAALEKKVEVMELQITAMSKFIQAKIGGGLAGVHANATSTATSSTATATGTTKATTATAAATTHPVFMAALLDKLADPLGKHASTTSTSASTTTGAHTSTTTGAAATMLPTPPADAHTDDKAAKDKEQKDALANVLSSMSW